MIGSPQTISKHESENVIVDKKSVVAEFNWNSAYEPLEIGVYTTDSSGRTTDLYFPGQVRKNLVRTPSASASGVGNHTLISAAGSSLTASSGDSTHGLGFSTYYEVAVTNSTTLSSQWGLHLHSGSTLEIDHTKSYSIVCHVKTNSTNAYPTSIILNFYDENNAFTRAITVKTTNVSSADGWTKISGVVDHRSINPNERYASISVSASKTKVSGSAANGDYLRVTGILLEASPYELPFFYGSSSNTAGVKYTWEGASDISASLMTCKRNNKGNWLGDPEDYEIINEYIDDSDVVSYVSTSTGKLNRCFSLYDCFTPNRPDSGIVHSKSSGASRFWGKGNILMQANSKTRFYPASEKYRFKYWHSSYMTTGATKLPRGVTDGNGYISDVAPYVVYSGPYLLSGTTALYDSLYGATYGTPVSENATYTTALYDSSYDAAYGAPVVENAEYVDKITSKFNNMIINSIRFKCQTYNGTSYKRKPVDFVVEVLGADSTTWSAVYTATGVTISDSGVFQVWKDPSTGNWSTTSRTIADTDIFNESVVGGGAGTEVIRGIRLRVRKMSASSQTSGVPFELIELAPLLYIDITSRVSSVSIQKGFNSTDLGLPFGTISADTGSVTIKNTGNVKNDINFYENNSVLRGMSRYGFKIHTNFIIDNPNGTDTIPLKPMYCDGIKSSSDMRLDLSLVDGLAALRETPAPSVFLRKKKITEILSILMDNVGITDYDFSDVLLNPEFNELINFFWSRPDNSLQEAVEAACKSAGAVLYQDEYGKFRLKSRGDIFGINKNSVATISDQSIEKLPDYEANFEYTAVSLAEIISKSAIWGIASGTSGYSVSVGPMAGEMSERKYDNALTFKRTANSGSIVIGGGTSTSVANKVLGYTHPGRELSFSIYGKTSSSTATVTIAIDYYDKDKLWLSTDYGPNTTLNSSSFTQVTTPISVSPANSAYFNLKISVVGLTAGGASAYFTNLTSETGKLASVKAYDVETVEPISNGTIQYSPKAIPKKENRLDKQNVLDKDRYLTDARTTLWSPGQKNLPTPSEALETADEAVLGSSILLKDLQKADQALKDYSSYTRNLKTEEEARAFMDSIPLSWITLEGQSANSIVNYQGYVMINGEIIRYDGREFVYVTSAGSKKATIRSPQEYQDLRTSVDTGISIYPTGRFRIYMKLRKMSYGGYEIVETGRAQFGTIERKHTAGLDTTSWTKRATIVGWVGVPTPEYLPTASVQQKSIFGNKTYFGNVVIKGTSKAGSNASQAEWVLGGLTRDVGANMDRWGTRVRIDMNNKKSQTAGLIVGTTVSASNKLSGYVFTITTTEAAGTANNIKFYKLINQGSYSSRTDVWSGKSAIYPASLNSVDNTLDLTSSTDDKVGIYDLEVSRQIISGNKWVFNLFINGNRVAEVIETSNRPNMYSGAGPIVGGQSTAAFENFWAVAGDLSAVRGQTSGPFAMTQGFRDIIKYGDATGALQTEFIKTKKYRLFFEEFGSPVREAKFFSARYEKFPATRLRVMNNGNQYNRYAIMNMTAGTFGAEMLVVNFSKGAISIGSNNNMNQDPLAVYGTAVASLGDRTLSLADLAQSAGREDIIDKMRQAKRRLGRDTSIDITGNFICTSKQAERLGTFYIDKLTDEAVIVNAEMFGNPCLQVGDIVGGKFMEQSTSDWKKYLITGVSHDFTSGLSTSVRMRSIGKW